MKSETEVCRDIPTTRVTGGTISVALVGPNEELRAAMADAVEGCQECELHQISAYPRNPGDLTRLVESKHEVVMVELDSDSDFSLDLVKAICAHGVATVMVYSKSDPDKIDEDLLARCRQAGAREYLSLPFVHSIVAPALIRAAGRRSVVRQKPRTSGRLLVFFGAKGGSGVTTIATNFAISLNQASSQSTLLIDLDLPLGDAALNLGIAPDYSTIDALQNFTRLDSNFFSKLLNRHASGLYVLAAPGEYPAFQASRQAIDKLLRTARAEFDNVVVDVGSKLDLASTTILEDATTIYLITQAGVPELRNSNRLISRYFSIDDHKLEIAINRWESRVIGVSEKHVKQALAKPAKWRIPNDYEAVRRMQNTSTALALTDSPVSALIAQMARAACGIAEIPQVEGRSNFKKLMHKLLHAPTAPSRSVVPLSQPSSSTRPDATASPEDVRRPRIAS